MADHELEFAAKFGLPEVHGLAARLEARYKGTWSTRRKRVAAAAIEAAGLTAHEFAEQLEADGNEKARDVMWQALERSNEVGDEDYLDALGRLAAAALDDALVDRAAYLSAELLKLEPLHLRVFASCFYYGPEEVAKIDWAGDTGPAGAVRALPKNVEAVDITVRTGIAPTLVATALERLSGFGLLDRFEPGHPRNPDGFLPLFHASLWGSDALLLIFPTLMSAG